MGMVEPHLVSCDPGNDATGLAGFDDAGRLVKAALLRPKGQWLETAPQIIKFVQGAGLVVVELPKGRGHRDVKKIDALIRLGFVAGLVAGTTGALVEEVHPMHWKGSRPKDVDNRYTLSILDEGELELVKAVRAPASLFHNLVDAVGIGLWRVGRR